MRYKLVATDFDDTLLKSDLTLSSYTLDVIKHFEKMGGKFIISTGRMYSSIYNSAMRVGLSKGLAITYQGALINDMQSGGTYYSNTMSTENSIKITRLLEKENGAVHVYINDELHVKEMTEETEHYEKICEIKAKVTGENLSDYIAKINAQTIKIITIIEPKRATQLYEEFLLNYGNDFEFCVSKPYFFEVNAKGSTKGNAVKFVCDRNGLTNDDVITFGDGNNDISMLEFAKLSFAVSNGCPDAKKAAKLICPSNDEDGVAQMIEKYCL